MKRRRDCRITLEDWIRIGLARGISKEEIATILDSAMRRFEAAKTVLEEGRE